MSDFRDLCDGMAAEITGQLGEPQSITIQIRSSARLAGELRDTETVIDRVVQAVRSLDNARLSPVGGGSAQTQGYQYLVAAAECLLANGSPFAPKEGDRVVDPNLPEGARTLLVGTVGVEAAGAMYRLGCSGLRKKTV